MTVTVNPDLMAPLADAGYTLISLHHWDTKAKCPPHRKIAYQREIANPQGLDKAALSQC